MQHHHSRRTSPFPRAAVVQPLEARRLLSAGPMVLPTVHPVATPLANGTTVTGYTPAQITTGYGLAGLKFGSTTATGAGQTIAIVDAYNDPDVASDLATFDGQFGLAAPTLSVVSQSGSTTALPSTNAGWGQEISLDVEWAHAIAPGAKILLVETTDDSTDNLMAGVAYARTVAGVSVVSMSWGSTEYSGETDYDDDFTTPSGHANITFVAAAGDDGSSSGAEWPAAAAGVVSVGGTTLTLSGSGAYTSETGWSSGGGGASVYEGEPVFQYAAQRTGYRTTPDVAWDASTSTGVAIYDSLADDGNSGWLDIGGTSAGTPQFAGLVALADQGRAAAGSVTLNGAMTTLPTIYGLYAHKSLYAADFHDITSGSTSGSVSAATGYDEVSGVGSPKGAALVAALVKATVSATLKQTAVTTTPTRGGGGHPHGGVESTPVLAVPPPIPGTAADGGSSAGTGAASAPARVAPSNAAFVGAPSDDGTAALATVATVASPTAAAAGDDGAGAMPAVAGLSALPDASSAPAPEAVVGLATAAATEFAPASATDAVPLPADVTGLPAPAGSLATAVSGQTAHTIGVGAVAAGTAVALWLATEPARVRRRDRAAADAPRAGRQWVAQGLFRG